MVLVKVESEGKNKGTFKPEELFEKFGLISFEFQKGLLFFDGLYEGNKKKMYYLTFIKTNEEDF